MLTGENGIINQAKYARTETARANFEDRLLLANGEAEMKRQQQGSLSSEEYFEILKNNEIISDITVGGYNISEPQINEDGSKTYEITSDDGYVFEATIYPDGRVKTEYQGKKDNLPPKIRKITVTNKQARGFDINVEIVRLEEGKISYYYREANTNEFIPIKENTRDLTVTLSNIDNGKIYNIKVVVENKKGKNEKVINGTTKQLVEAIELDRTEAILEKGEQLQLTATVKPETAEDKVIEWSSSNTNIAEVDQDGLVKTKADGTITIKAKATDGGEAFAICNITVENKVTAAEIAENPEIYYGKVVKNYTAGGAKYRIFYVDIVGKYGTTNTVYLKADWEPSRTTSLSSYSNYNKTTTKVKEMNPYWANNRGSSESEWSVSEQAAAWLCTPATGRNEGLPWSDYFESGKASYVIGSPSGEMYVDSYNSVPHVNIRQQDVACSV
ncbi:MAG: Ig-like domain-containing protein [Clostridia bacterium]|jgi:hypothetical protein|nr:Ig-like domain-containing protein [Clostridia bacterium]